MKNVILPAVVSAAFISISQAALTNAVVLSADFTGSEFTSGRISGQSPGAGQGNFLGPGRFQIGTTGGIQTARNFDAAGSAGGNGRLLFPETLDLSAQDVVVGDRIQFTLNGFTVISDSNDNNILALGLASNGGGGAANVLIGSTLTRDDQALLLDGSATTVSIGDRFDLGLLLIAESAGPIATQLFTVQSLVNGTVASSLTGQSIQPDTATGQATFLQGIVQDRDGGSATSAVFTIEGATIETIAVPEPSSALLGLLGCLSLLRRRRA